MREKLIDIVEAYADFLDWDTKEEMVDSIMEFLATANNVGSKWIPVTERLPKKNGQYLCNYHFGEYPTMTFTRVLDYYATDIVPHFQHTLGDGSMKVTHWMPLPEPPKGE